MAINPDEIIKDWWLANEGETGEHALAAGTGKQFIIIRFVNGKYAVFTPSELEAKLKMWKALATPLGQVPANAFMFNLAQVVDPRLEKPEEEEQVKKAKEGTLFVLRVGDQIVGLFKRPDVFRGIHLAKANGGGGPEISAIPVTGGGGTPSPEDIPSGMGPGTLSPEDMPSPVPPPPSVADKRFINAEVEDHDKTQPLQMGTSYTLVFDVDVEARAGAVKADPLKLVFKDEETIDLTVQLASEDFAVNTEAQKLHVPKFGKSKNKARFDIEAKHEGTGTLNAVFLKDGAFIQLMTLTLRVGGAGAAMVGDPTTLGYSLEAATEVKPRDLSLTILNNGANFTLLMSGAVDALATIPLNQQALAKFVDLLRTELLAVVYADGGAGKPRVYQASIDIPPEVNQASLARLAKAGMLLYNAIFFGANADAQLNLLGNRFRELAQTQDLRIQIHSQDFVMPWGLLYMASKWDPNHLDPKLFLGLRHIIEHIPLQQNMHVFDEDINSQPKLTVSLNVNADIDDAMGAPFIKNQIAYWNGWGQKAPLTVVTRQTKDDVLNALADGTTTDNLLYFYCHAVSKAITDQGGPGSSTFVFTGDQRVTLDDLNLSAPASTAFANAPLVFVNACESAKLSPLYYGGFVTYFMAKGARGVIGTECETPAVFAADFAKQFFMRFLNGKESIGEIFLALRQDYYAKHNNLLGLLYALYCNGDTEIKPGVQVA